VVKPVIAALESGDRNLIAKFEDLPKDFSFEEMMANDVKSLQEQETNKLRSGIQRARKKAVRDLQTHLALQARLGAARGDAASADLLEQVISSALAEGRDVVEALIDAGVIKKSFLKSKHEP
jgi:hypothetical protein